MIAPSSFPSRLCTLMIALVVPLLWSMGVSAENNIEVTERFFKLTFDEDSGSYQRTEIDTAKPGDLIELEIQAKNIGSGTAIDVELVNQVPTGAARMVDGSIELDEDRSEVQLSPNGDTFFPSSVEIPADSIRFVKWLIYELAADNTLNLSYRLRIARPEPQNPPSPDEPESEPADPASQ